MLKLDIVNLYLSRVGCASVTTITDTRASRAGSAQLKHSLKALLEAHPWDFLKKQVELEAEDTDDVEPIFGYTYAFILPVDFCRICEEDPTGFDYEIVAGYLYANDDTIDLTYVAFPYSGTWSTVTGIGAVSNWIELGDSSVIFDNPVLPSNLYEVLGIHMALKCSYQITGDHDDVKLLTELYNRELTAAKSTTAQQKRDMFMEATDWDDARI